MQSFLRTKFHALFSRADWPLATALIGAAGFMLSLLVALLMLQGNPGILLVWLAATAAMAAYLRLHRQWRAMFERIYATRPARTELAARKDWRGDVEEVAFRDFPRQSSACGK